MNYRQQYPGVGGSIEQLFPLRNWCAVVLSFGPDLAWVLCRRTGGFRLHHQLFLISSGSLYISGVARVYICLCKADDRAPCVKETII